jgi:3-deoxy-D-manno-octulosonate 8-phosphate phosphatase KdsC-like HAD superfamily phosphatase
MVAFGFCEDGEDQKAFHTRDGLGLDIWHRSGLKVRNNLRVAAQVLLNVEHEHSE